MGEQFSSGVPPSIEVLHDEGVASLNHLAVSFTSLNAHKALRMIFQHDTLTRYTT